MPSSVLCFGHDPILVRTRQQIFQRAGFTSRIAESLEELNHYFAEYAVDVLVICHTVATEECQMATTLAHNQVDRTLVLVLRKGARSEADGEYASFESMQGPEGLLRTISTLLKERDQDSQVSHQKKPLPALPHEIVS